MKIPFLLLLCTGLGAQEVYFKEETPKWWIPQYAILVDYDHIEFPYESYRPSIYSTDGVAWLRWTLGTEENPFQLKAGFSSSLSSSPNSTDLVRFENMASNGTFLDIADLRFHWTGAKGGVEINAGLVENGLLRSESLWDPNLRVIGGGGKFFLRTEDGLLEEGGIRLITGEVRLIDGGRVKINAAQAVLRFQTGPVNWSLQGGPWNMEARQEDATKFRRQNPGTLVTGYADPEFQFTVYGASFTWMTTFPIEVSGIRHENRQANDVGEEFQAWLGSRSKTWWPYFGYIRQLLGPSGALASVNGDQWWFHANADGERYVVGLNLPKRWRLEGTFVEQRLRGAPFPVTRGMIILGHRF